MIFEAKI